MKGYIKALRLPVCIMGGSLVLVGYRLAHEPMSTDAWLQAVFSLIIMATTMAWNDWRDRFHDAGKGKTFASDRGCKFLVFSLALLAVSATLGTVVALAGWKETGLVVSMIVICLLYSEMRQLPFVPNTFVAFGSALPILFAPAGHNALIVFLATAFAIYAREILKDFKDEAIDSGYKWTTIQRFGRRFALSIATALLILSCMVLVCLEGSRFISQVMYGQVFGLGAILALIASRIDEFGESQVSMLMFALDFRVALYLLTILCYWAP